MAKSKNDALHGSLDLLFLKALEAGPMHGWAITLHVESISNNVLRVEEGSLYPAPSNGTEGMDCGEVGAQ